MVGTQNHLINPLMLKTLVTCTTIFAMVKDEFVAAIKRDVMMTVFGKNLMDVIMI